MNSYQPIDCGLHSRFELAAMRERPLRLGWRSADGELRRELVLALDLITCDGAEYLVVEFGGERLRLRLDWILDFEALPLK